MSVEGLEKERDFYFGKLRDIEVMCQDCDNGGDPPPIVQKILEVLYATEVIHWYYFSIFNCVYFCNLDNLFAYKNAYDAFIAKILLAFFINKHVDFYIRHES